MLPWYVILLIVIGVVVVLGLIFIVPMIPITLHIAKKIYFGSFVRTNKDMWGHVCSCPSNEEQVKMFNAGIAFKEKHKDIVKEVNISNDSLYLYGQFFDFNKKETVIILPGRCESLYYSYYYAITYEDKYNVLVVDQRAHGNSEGMYSTAGIKEGEDALAWAKYLKTQLGQEKVFIHGVCVGGAGATRAASLDQEHKFINGLVLDGIFISFLESIRTHTISEGHHPFPVVNEIPLFYKKYAGVEINKITPVKMMKDVDIPILFIHCKNDQFSLPNKLHLVVDASPSKDKTVVWFDKGSHSHVRFHNEKEYDATILSFLGDK